MVELPNVRLNVASKPENVLLVREMLVGVAEAIELDGNDLEDLRTAVSEACNNVVLHAYQGECGPLEVEVYASSPGTIEVVVRDRGIGLQPRAHPPGDTSVGLGLPVIGALTRRLEFRDVPGGGSEVRMEFTTPRTRALEPLQADETEPCSHLPAGELDGAVALSVAPTALLPTVLPRVLSVLAVHARFSTDRISDAQLLADALAAHLSRASAHDRLDIGVSVEPRNLELHLGPLDAGAAKRLIGDSVIDGLGPVLEKLADDHSVAVAGASETLALRMIDRR